MFTLKILARKGLICLRLILFIYIYIVILKNIGILFLICIIFTPQRFFVLSITLVLYIFK